MHSIFGLKDSSNTVIDPAIKSNQQTMIDNLPLEIAQGNITGTTFINKFGEAPDFDTTDNEVTVWDGANDGAIDQMVYQYSTSADIDSLVSSNNGDTQSIEVQGLDSSYNLVTQTITITGQTRKALDTSLIRVFRMINRGSTGLAAKLSCYVDSSITAGVVDDSTKVRAIINDGGNQTLMAVYTIPNGKTGYLVEFEASTSGANKSTNYRMVVKARPFGEVFQYKHVSAISDAGSSRIQHFLAIPDIFAAKTDIEITTQAKAAGVTAASVSSGFDLILIDD